MSYLHCKYVKLVFPQQSWFLNLQVMRRNVHYHHITDYTLAAGRNPNTEIDITKVNANTTNSYDKLRVDVSSSTELVHIFSDNEANM